MLNNNAIYINIYIYIEMILYIYTYICSRMLCKFIILFGSVHTFRAKKKKFNKNMYPYEIPRYWKYVITLCIQLYCFVYWNE